MNRLIKIWEFIVNHYFLVIILISAFSALSISAFNTYNNIAYYGIYKEGIIIDKSSERLSDPEATYTYLVYKILSNSNDTLHSLTSDKYDIQLGDKVRGNMKGEKYLNILEVNGEKIQCKYGLEDFVSIAILIVTISILFFYTKKKIKK